MAEQVKNSATSMAFVECGAFDAYGLYPDAETDGDLLYLWITTVGYGKINTPPMKGHGYKYG